MQERISSHHLDYNCQFRITLRYNEAERSVTLSIDEEGGMHRRTRGNLLHLANITPARAGSNAIKGKIEGNIVTFHNVPEPFRLDFGGKPFAIYTPATADSLTVSELRPFTVSALRTLGSQHKSKASPYYLPNNFESFEPLRKQAKATINTDFHTHSSGQISAKGLIEVALAHNALYPEHLLNDIGISVAKSVPRTKQKRIRFQPLEPQNLPDDVACVPLSALTDAQRDVLKDALSLRTDRQHSYTDAENECYRLRYPFTKNTTLIKDSIKQMARESMAEGVMHVEMSFVGLDKPETFRAVHEAIWEMEHSEAFKGFTLLLKHGIPRTLNAEQMRESLDKAKILVKSPYVVGVDFLGYEINKTASFDEVLDDFAAWVSHNAPDFSICIHAGENDKNPENVTQAIRIAAKHNVRMRIGHGLYGLSDEAIALAKPLTQGKVPKLHIEANPDSNIALNNINNLGDMPFRKMLENNIPFVVSSDSLGLYQTSSEQLGLSLLHAGLDARDLSTLATHQNTLATAQRSYVQQKAEKLGNWRTTSGRDGFLNTLQAELTRVPKAAEPDHKKLSDAVVEQILGGPKVIPDKRTREKALSAPHSERRKFMQTEGMQELRTLLNTKTPITVVGASGSSWKDISPAHQREVAIALDMLTQVLDPEKVYFVQGRNKHEGLCKQLNTTVKRSTMQSSTPFTMAGLLTDPTPDRNIDYSHLDYAIRIDNPLNVSDEIVDFTVRHDGVLLAIGGRAFTRDIILKADCKMEEDNKGALLVMNGPTGASTEKAKIMDDSYSFKDGKELIYKLQDLLIEKPELFKENYRDLNRQSLATLYEFAAERVGYPAGKPEVKGHTITGATQLDLFNNGKGRG